MAEAKVTFGVIAARAGDLDTAVEYGMLSAPLAHANRSRPL